MISPPDALMLSHANAAIRKRKDYHGMMQAQRIREPQRSNSVPGNVSRRGWMTLVLCVTMAIFGCPANASAQVTTIYSYNSSNQVISAIISTGSGVQYVYDAAGNRTSVVAITPQSLAQGTPDAVTFNSSSQAGLLLVNVTAGQTVTLTESSLAISPSGDAVTVDVFNSAGSLVGSFNTATASAISVTNLPAGIYSVFVLPATPANGSLQLAFNSVAAGPNGSGSETDGPIPIWALFALGSGLLGLARRAKHRLREPT